MISVLLFTAPWCSSCQQAHRAMFSAGIDAKKINIDLDREMALKYHVLSIPTVVVLSHGEEIHRQMGRVDVPRLKEALA